MNRMLATTLLAVLAVAPACALAQQGEAAPSAPSQTALTQAAPAQVAPAAIKSANDNSYTQSLTVEGTQPGDSHVRIVRLSDVRGKVYMDRNVGRGPEAVMQNMPIEQGMALATGSDGFAEVEFEDGSTLRLAPGTEVRFPLLVLRSSGGKASTMLVDRGIVYVHTQKSKDAELSLAMGKARFAVAPGSHVRLDMTGPKVELAVIAGEVSAQADGGAGTVVAKEQTLSLDRSGSGAADIDKSIYESTYDEWDRNAMQYHDRYLRASRNMGSMPLYGVSDLNYYGSFVNGCGGSFWQPYFASAGWNPYSQGTWTLYSQGYSWVSPYPWGWLPFHTGAWNFCPGMGWGWRPGGTWFGVQNISLLNGGGAGMRSIIHPPGAMVGAQSMVGYSNGPMVRSMMSSPDSFTFRRDSAGLGVPRGSLGELQRFSKDAAKYGFSNVGIDPSTSGPHDMMVRGPNGEMRPAQPGGQPAPVQRGPSPGGMSSGDDRFSWKNQPRPANPPAPATTIPQHPTGPTGSAPHP